MHFKQMPRLPRVVLVRTNDDLNPHLLICSHTAQKFKKWGEGVNFVFFFWILVETIVNVCFYWVWIFLCIFKFASPHSHFFWIVMNGFCIIIGRFVDFNAGKLCVEARLKKIPKSSPCPNEKMHLPLD